MSMKKRIVAALGLLVVAVTTCAQTSTLPVDGYAKTSVNAVVFRGSSVTTFGNTQYVAWYDGSGKVVLAKRTLGSTTWQSSTTQYSGNVADAHNCISIGVDGDGVVHMAWDMHSTKLRYARGTAAGSLTMGSETDNLASGALASGTYPQFFRLPDGNLLFMVRDGSSGNGNLMLYRWDLKTHAWTRLFASLIDGQGARNAYWEAHLDRNGVLHVGWVWRETSDVATNHDICYARSRDGGVTWENSKGVKYTTPITAATAEYAATIPQKSELINQTSIHGDEKSRPYIASYWVPTGGTVPQYQLVWNDGNAWKTSVISRRTIDFSLSGVGTKKIPISRPQVLVDGSRDSIAVYMVYRDTQETSKVSLYQTSNLAKGAWSSMNLTTYTVDSWEPSYDADLWASSRLLHIFVQRAGQGDGETSVNLDPQPVTILEWRPPTTVSASRKTVSVGDHGGEGTVDAMGRRIGPMLDPLSPVERVGPR